ncbi:hypothetical protein LCGC14_0365380 [marine sediment metagenome]|uniref:Uncharacterized protein n=1 Tax=marine sediment metagenome TaxID=412755 RepID=A0A0F9TPK9_9ZZZZ
MDRLLEGNRFQIMRFSCGCYDAGHSLSVVIERDDEGNVIECSFEPYLVGKPRLWWRIKQAIKCLKGKDGGLGDFTLREEDYSEMVNLVSSLVRTNYTSGT